MQLERNKKAAIIFCILTVICMALIFYFSSKNADESNEQSDVVLNWLISIFGENSFTVLIVRKGAHCLEFTGLCILFNCAWYFIRRKKSVVISVLCASAYAIADEVHQLFVVGRSCNISDWAIDTAGSILGAIGFFVIFSIISSVIKKKKSIDINEQ